MQNEPYVEKLQRLTKQAQECNDNIKKATLAIEECFNRIDESYAKIREITEQMRERCEE